MNEGKCKGCGAPILWARSERGAPMPLDPVPMKRVVVLREVAHIVDTYQSHFISCPAAEQFRKQKEALHV